MERRRKHATALNSSIEKICVPKQKDGGVGDGGSGGRGEEETPSHTLLRKCFPTATLHGDPALISSPLSDPRLGDLICA